MTVLHGQVRQGVRKKAKWTTLIVLDLQAVQNTCNASKAQSLLCQTHAQASCCFLEISNEFYILK